MARMHRTQLYLDEERRRVLDERARKTGKSLGQLVREAVDEVYRSKRTKENPLSQSDPIWSFIGTAESREGDISRRHDRYLYGSDDESVRRHKRVVRSQRQTRREPSSGSGVPRRP